MTPSEPIVNPAAEEWFADIEARIEALARDQPSPLVEAVLLLCDINLMIMRAINQIAEEMPDD